MAVRIIMVNWLKARAAYFPRAPQLARKDTMGPANRAIVAALVKRRKERRLTQIDIAHALRTDQGQVSKWERCERRLDVVDYARFCRAVGLDPCEPLRAIKLK
jgi:hypothetical protein